MDLETVIDNQINSKLNCHNNNNDQCDFGVDKMIRMKGYPVNCDPNHQRDVSTITTIKDQQLNTSSLDDTSNDKIHMSRTVRETIFADVNDYFSQLSTHLKQTALKVSSKETETSVINLQNGFNQILTISGHYEYKHLPANGYVTYCVMIRSWLIKCCAKLNSINQIDSIGNNQKGFLNDLIIVLKGFLTVKDMLVHLHQHHLNDHQRKTSTESEADADTINNNNNSDQLDLPLFSSTIDETVWQLEQCFDTTGEFQEALGRSFNLFWLSPRTKVLLKLYQKGISWTYANFLKSWRVLANKRYRCKTFVKLANRANIGFPVDVATIVDTHFSRKVARNVLYRNKDAIGVNFWVQRQGRWFVPPVGPGIVEQSPPQTGRPVIRCRFIKHRSKPVRPEVLIFHCHGSGFILSRPDLHDAYLKPWVARLDGVSVLSVDYSLMAPYPEQFQDVLDAYLWVTSGDDSVVEKIGFHPKKIVLIGDSAGSMLAVAIPLLLYEIGKKVTSNENNNHKSDLKNSAPIQLSTPINMPVAFISFYGTFQLTGAWSSSRIMTIFDPILHYGNILAIAGCLSGIQGRIDDPQERPKNRFAKVSSFIAEDIKLVKRTMRPRKVQPWYLENGKVANDKFQALFKRLQSPYLNLPTFDSYEALKDISLCLITSFGCIFLDDNIALARSWKGPCEVHVLEGQIHGFLFMKHEKAANKFADEKVIQFINKFLEV